MKVESVFINICLVRKGKMGGRRKGKDPNHGNSTMVKMRRFMVTVRTMIISRTRSLSSSALTVLYHVYFRQRNKNF